MPGWTAAAIAGAGALGAGSSLLGAGKSASAAKDAAGLQQQQYQQTRADLSPYTQTGTGVLGSMASLAQSGPYGPGGTNYVSQAASNLPLGMTQAELEQTPGYQFTLAQGLKSTQAANAARGLGVSGAALKGAATFATGLADQTYAQQFGLQQQKFADILNLNTAQQGNLQNQFQRLQNTAALGESAGAQTGQQGTQAASVAGNYLNQAGLAQAAGTSGVSSAATGAVQNYLTNNLLQTYLANQGGPTSGYGPAQNTTWNTGE